MIELHNLPGNANMAHTVLQQLGLPFSLQPVDRNRQARNSPADRAPDRNGLVLLLADRARRAGRAQAYPWLVWPNTALQAMLIHHVDRRRLVDGGTRAAAAQAQAEAPLAAHGQPWLLGAHHSVAVPYARLLCRWARAFSGPAAAPARQRPAIRGWLHRMPDRPAGQRLLQAEGQAAPRMGRPC